MVRLSLLWLRLDHGGHLLLTLDPRRIARQRLLSAPLGLHIPRIKGWRSCLEIVDSGQLGSLGLFTGTDSSSVLEEFLDGTTDDDKCRDADKQDDQC